MDWLISFAIFTAVYLRWWLLERFLGKAGMYLFDMLLCTICAARLVAVPGSSPTFNFILAVISAAIALFSASEFVKHLKKGDDASVDD